MSAFGNFPLIIDDAAIKEKRNCLATEVTARQSRNQKTSATEGTEITEKLAIKNEESA
jgi:hypothetical protein